MTKEGKFYRSIEIFSYLGVLDYALRAKNTDKLYKEGDHMTDVIEIEEDNIEDAEKKVKEVIQEIQEKINEFKEKNKQNELYAEEEEILIT